MPPVSGCYYKDSPSDAIVTELAHAINHRAGNMPFMKQPHRLSHRPSPASMHRRRSARRYTRSRSAVARIA